MSLTRKLILPFVLIAIAAASYPLLKPLVRELQSPPKPQEPQFSVLAIGWDGSRRATVQALLEAGKLPVLRSFSDQGTFIEVTIDDGRTDTKAGWTQIFTGYSASVTGVESNRDYQPIPKGLTIFERLKDRFGARIRTLFLSGKVNNIGARGPHKVCINCRSRFDDTHGKTGWWDDKSEAPTKKGEAREYIDRAGEPYFNALPALDKYINKLGESKNVLAAAKQELLAVGATPFFAFVHFEEPDEQGHLKGEGSKEYLAALENNDKNLSELIDLAGKIQQATGREIKIFVLSDHGFDARQFSHKHAPDTFWAASEKNLRSAADRRDFTPTLLELYGFRLKDMVPPLNGRSLKQ